MLFSLYIINKAGGCVWSKEFVERKRSTDEFPLRLASTFHAMHVMAMNSNPTKAREPSGLSTIETGTVPSSLALISYYYSWLGTGVD